MEWGVQQHHRFRCGSVMGGGHNTQASGQGWHRQESRLELRARLRSPRGQWMASPVKTHLRQTQVEGKRPSPGIQLDPPPAEWGSRWTWPGRRGRGGPPPVVEAHGAGAGVGVPSFLSNSSLMTLRGPLNGHVLETPGPVLPSCADPLSIAPQDSPETRTRPVPWHPGSPSVLTPGRAGWTHRPCRRAS